MHALVELTCTNYFRCIISTAALENIAYGFVNLLASIFVIHFAWWRQAFALVSRRLAPFSSSEIAFEEIKLEDIF